MIRGDTVLIEALDGLPDGVVLLRPSGNSLFVEYANEAFWATVGPDGHREKGADFYALLGPRAACILRGEWIDLERPDGRQVRLEATVSNLKDGRRLLIFRDLGHAQEQARLAKEELQEYLYVISHDFRAPIRGIMMSAMILLEDFADGLEPGARSELKRQNDAAKRLGGQLDEVLKLSRIGTAPFEPGLIDLSTIAEDVRKELSPGVEFDHSVQIQAGMRAFGEPTLVRGLMLQLLSNALKFRRPERGARVEIGRDGTSFFVRDDGIGFSEEQAKRVFRIFEKLNGDLYPGFGCGLTQAKRIVERHGGVIWMESVPGHGTTARFTLG